ncbi:GNAT family N-acetyltransferase [Actinoplanes bogorensis]|uniref:GNAT family N-acetyltransferase n=1 Tax=Paractinoplanes bogorensis TaxID=1610840 RepID=A0ABS5YSI8_9ACTN|nr:GNAT family N-acetyltransferase [Actinoplanes bogorensis]MBU2666036.1 GNAT family N-acetyltransferase [Actinoplanes bogorensis]
MSLAIDFVPVERAGDEWFVAGVVALVNRVYADAEAGMWDDGADRTDASTVAAMIGAGELVAAFDGDRLVGTVRAVRLDRGTGEFGMLVADPDVRGQGVGRELVRFAEEHFGGLGCDTMQLELLVPQAWKHPVKEFLRSWYTRMGYAQVTVGDLATGFPHLVPRLATPCDFLIFRKGLPSQVRAGD